MLIKKLIPGFYNGVSQQPSELRLDTQCELQENMLGTLTEGLTQRPQTNFISKLTNSSIYSDTLLHGVDKSEDEKYLIAITRNLTNPIEIYTLDGTPCTVNYIDNAKDYFRYMWNPCKDFKLVSIADYTIAVNKNKTATVSEIIDSDVKIPQALLYVNHGVPSTDYKVYINDKLAATYSTDSTTYKTSTIATNLYASLLTYLTLNQLVINPPPQTLKSTPENPLSTPAISLTIDGVSILNSVVYSFSRSSTSDQSGTTYYINPTTTMDNIYNLIKNALNSSTFKVLKANGSITITRNDGAGFTSSITAPGMTSTHSANSNTAWDITYKTDSDCILIQRKDKGDFTFKTYDSWGQQSLLGIKDTIQSFLQLPGNAYEDFYVEVTGDVGNKFDNYYVQYKSKLNETDGDDVFKGVWKEVVKKGLKNSLNASTLPHQIVRTDTNTFTVSPINWESRKVGDDESTPMPSFIDNTINDVFYFQNRLGFISKESVILSKTGDFFNFFPTTATDILDDDPIDETVSSVRVNILNSALPFNENLLLDSNQQQFILTSGNYLLTPKTVQILPITQYQTSKLCKPVSMGNSIYYLVENENYLSVLEYLMQDNGLLTEALDITQHIDKYIPINPLGYNINSMVSHPSKNMLFIGKGNELYVYKATVQNNQKLQASWFKWTFDNPIESYVAIGTDLFLISNHAKIINNTTVCNERCLLKMSLSNCPNRFNPDGGISILPFTVHLDELVGIYPTYYNEQSNKTILNLPYSDASTNFIVIDGIKGSLINNTNKINYNTIEIPGNHIQWFYVGKLYNCTYRFSELFYKNQENIGDLEGRLTVNKLLLEVKDSGPFQIEITPKNRNKKIYTFNEISDYDINGVPITKSYTQSCIISCNSKKTIIDLVINNYIPVKFILAEFIGFYYPHARAI